MARPLAKIAPLLFLSGACSLVYETVWLRELRLVFGASTMASAAVVACFVGGLGAGGLFFGKRANAHPRPLAMYAALEGVIAASAAVTPALLWLVRATYVGLGGTRALGDGVGTALRLVLSALVFAVPTLCMGGTLPAVARAVERDDDPGRRGIALLYGVNTLGAVTGCMASTFFLFELFGTRLSLFVACLVNALVAVLARALSRGLPEVERTDPPASDLVAVAEPRAGARPPAWFTLAAAATSGFVFCLMELVWYRMLGPLLGGSVFTFGVILAVALLGIGLGGVAYGLRPHGSVATRAGFAWTCILEAIVVGVPYALGDRLAVLAAVMRPIGGLGFGLKVAGWTFITAVVVLPTAIVSGVQFTLLVSLMGAGRRDAARDVGRVYGANTAGAIVGSLAGGFGLIPWLTSQGCWRLVVYLLVAVALVALATDTKRRPLVAALQVVAAASALLLAGALGPTAAWRHSPIGAGRIDPTIFRSPNDVVAWEHLRRSAIDWEVDGRESSVAIARPGGLAFVVNGKVDGSARGDAGTTVMAGILGAMLHPHPTRAMVIGLGTGETAGWLGAIDAITDVDVAELEPAILEVARRSAPANHAALDNPKVHVELGDARELLLTSRHRYSVIMSEPSNPYRAGVASLFTSSYYEAIKDRLDEDGLFLQWLQGYEVDGSTVRAVYATLGSVFPEVETWELNNEDLLLIGSVKPIVHDARRMRELLRQEPYRSASGRAWRATDLEAFLGHFVATGGLARRIAARDVDRVNTDDLNLVEFGFARMVGTGISAFKIADVRREALAHGEARPVLVHGAVDWDDVDELKLAFDVGEARLNVSPSPLAPDRAHRVVALQAIEAGDPARAVAEWRAQPSDPTGPTEAALVAMAFAEVSDESAAKYAEPLRAFEPAEEAAVLAHLRLRRGDAAGATSLLEQVFARLRADPWPMTRLARAALADASLLVATNPELAPRIYAALREPFVLTLFDAERQDTAFQASLRTPGPACVEALAGFGRFVPWDEGFLRARYDCLRAAHDPRAPEAEGDWRAFVGAEPRDFGAP
jgi:spermidine synthase